MPLKNILSRPSTSAGSNKRLSTIDSSDSPKSNKSPERGHRKIGSLHRLSLSFTPSEHGAFHHFLTKEPEEMSRKNSLALTDDDPTSHQKTTGPLLNGIEKVQSNSAPMLATVPNHQELPEEQDRENDGDDEDVTPKPQRFSLMKFKHASEPQLSARYKQSRPSTAEQPPPPKIITTAPTQHYDEDLSRKSKDKFRPRPFNTFRKSMVVKEESPIHRGALLPAQHPDPVVSSAPNLIRAMTENSPWRDRSTPQSLPSPPAYGDESSSALALPITRLSESGGSEGSSGSHKLYAQTTTTHFIQTTTTIFKLKRNRKKKTKDKGPLFPLPERLPKQSSERASTSYTNDSSSIADRASVSPSRRSTQNVRWQHNLSRRDSPYDTPSASATALTNAPLGSPGPAIARKHSTLSNNSGQLTPTGTLVPPRLGARGRSSTMGSLGRSSDRLNDNLPSGRTSTSTTGRRSFGDLLTQRLRKDSAPPRHGSNNSGSTPGSKANSFQIARDAEPELVYPQREEEDTPASYLEKLEAAVPRGAMATILCKSNDDFSKTCLRKYMRGFSYFGESIDMSIRKMLMEVILPKETQQIDRLLAGFADRYHECNPGIFMNADEANFLAFSILLLQSDNHNKNNKRKMTKQDYVKNTQNGKISVAEDILDCFYDNTCYTPFIHFDDEFAVNNHRLGAPKRRGGLIRTKSSEMLRGPVDPYTLILDHKLEILRPSLKDVIETEDPYGTAPINTNENHRAFVHAAVLQIVSARSRPDAFTQQATITNPADAQVGLVSIKVAKVGLLWRKSAKKKKAKSPWQEWGVVLTDSKLYFFKDVGWVKKLIGQYEGQAKLTTRNAPLVFKPPLTSFDPDAWMAVDDSVALTDSNYKRHKNAFTFIKHGGFEEVFLANSDAEASDWMSKLNYAATFRTAGVRMRGLLGNNYEGRNLYRKDSEVSNKTDASQATDGPVSSANKTNPQLAWEIMFYRRQLVSEKISTFDDHVAAAQKELDYLQRNARHLLVLLPIQQKTREGIVFAAGRMNAKLKWTRKEIWRARIHRDILVKDLEAEATQAFPAPATATPSNRASSSVTTPLKATPTKAGLARTDTEQTLKSNLTKSPAVMTPGSANGTRRPSQAVLEQITTDSSEPPELSSIRSASATQGPLSPTASPKLTDGAVFGPRVRAPSVHTQASQHFSQAGDSQAPTDTENEDALLREAGLLGVDGQPVAHEERRGSESGKDHAHKHHLPQTHPHTHDNSLKDRAGSVRRSLQRTLRESSHVHVPHHARSKKGKDSGSSMAATEDGKSIMSGESEELKRDPTGRFVLHGKKASVITMGPEWQGSSEDRMKLREQMLAEKAINDSAEQRSSLHIDTDMIDASRRSITSVRLSPGAAVYITSNPEVDNSRRSMADSNRFSLYSAATTPAGTGEIFHSAESSPRQSVNLSGNHIEPDSDDEESTFVKDEDGFIKGLKPLVDANHVSQE